MAVATGPYLFRNPVLTVETISYTNQVATALLTPETSIQTYKTLDPVGTIQDVDNAVWSFQLAGIQNALAEVFYAAPTGDELEVVLQTKPGSGKRKATFTILAMPVPFGGTTGEFLTFDQTFPVLGSPVWSVSS